MSLNPKDCAHLFLHMTKTLLLILNTFKLQGLFFFLVPPKTQQSPFLICHRKPFNSLSSGNFKKLFVNYKSCTLTCK